MFKQLKENIYSTYISKAHKLKAVRPIIFQSCCNWSETNNCLNLQDSLFSIINKSIVST